MSGGSGRQYIIALNFDALMREGLPTCPRPSFPRAHPRRAAAFIGGGGASGPSALQRPAIASTTSLHYRGSSSRGLPAWFGCMPLSSRCATALAIAAMRRA